jgi:hypothetical protein
MKISFAITVSKEIEEIKGLVSFLMEHKRPEDEIVILFDNKNGDKDILDFLIPLNVEPNIRTWLGNFNYDFADWKNKLNDYCSGDYIFQLDADEMIGEYLIKNINEIISMNDEVELFFLPRINIVNGITQDHINRWGWRIDDMGRINFPDFQGRVYKKGMQWQGRVHERIIGTKFYSLLPSDQEEYCIKHYKDITRQEKQNELYSKI